MKAVRREPGRKEKTMENLENKHLDAFESDPGLECEQEGHFDLVAVYNENCVQAGRRCYPDDRRNAVCGYPHGDVHFITEEEAKKLGI